MADFEAIVRAVFAASDKAIGNVHTAEEHIERTVAQLRSDADWARALVAALSETDGPA